MENIVVAAWLSAGALGSFLIWRLWMVDFHDGRWCPTPRAILFGALGSIGGPVILFVGFVVRFIVWVERMDWRESWWARPICEKKRGDA